MPHRYRTGFTLAVLVLGLALSLAGCGKKASHLDAPDEDNDHFPLVYPDPATDPKPDAP